MKKLLLSVFSLLILHHSACFSLDKGEDKVDIKIAAAGSKSSADTKSSTAQIASKKSADHSSKAFRKAFRKQLEDTALFIKSNPDNKDNTAKKPAITVVSYTVSFPEQTTVSLSQFADHAKKSGMLKEYALENLKGYDIKVNSAHFLFTNNQGAAIFVPIELE